MNTETIPSTKDARPDDNRTPQPDDSRVIDALEAYVQALESGPRPNRAAFLARYPDIAEALAGCLDGLDFVHGTGHDLAPSGSDSAASTHSAAGLPLGDFRLVREIGRGGMGVVYEAEQMSLGRRVALKVLPFAAALDDKQLQRFKNEAQAAAHLHHQNIVPVYSVGCERAVHFYAMQYIEGQTLASVIADLRLQTADSPKRADSLAKQSAQPLESAICNPQSAIAPTPPVATLSTEHSAASPAFFRSVARLGIQAAEALDYSHELGVIHRDVKPANLLLDHRGKIWVTDFGLAHCQSQAGLTMSGDLVGTLRYMSPEQALAQRVGVDHRTDIYSLGATLYELLTLEPVFTGDRQELLRQIAFEEPKAARRHNKSIPAELETILLKALEKNPADRYASAKDLAEDLERFVKDEPIRARRPSVRRRLVQWARRHRAVVCSAAIIALILTASLGWIVRDWQARRVEAEMRVAEALEVVEPKLREGNPHDPELVSAARKAEAHLAGGVVRDEAKQRVEQVLADLAMLAKLEEIRLVPAAANEEGFDFGAADLAYARAFREYGIDIEALGAEEAAERIRQGVIGVHVAAALDDWARVRMKLGQTNAKQSPQGPRWQQLLQIAQSADPDPWRGSLREAMAKGQQGSEELKKLVASAPIAALAPTTLDLFARALRDAGAVPSAALVLRQAQRLYPGDFWINQNLGSLLASAMKPPQFEEAIGFYRAALALRPKSAPLHYDLAVSLIEQRKLPEAVEVFRKATELQPNSGAAYNTLAVALLRLKKLPEAVQAARKAIELQPGDAMPYNSLGNALKEQKMLPQAIEAYRKAIELRPTSMWHYNLGNALAAQKKLPEGIAAYRKAIDLRPNYAEAYNNLGEALRAQQKLPEAEAAYRKAIELQPDYAGAYSNLGNVLTLRHKLPEAEAACRKAIKLQPDFAGAHYNLGIALVAQKNLPEAIAAYRKAIELQPELYEAYHNLALVLAELHKLPEAEAAWRKALELRPNSADTYTMLGNVLGDQGKPAEAEAAYRKAIEELNPNHAEAYNNLGNLLRGQKKLSEAEAACRKAIEIDPHFSSYNGLGQALWDQQKLPEAVAAYRKAIQLKPDNVEAYHNLGMALRDQKKLPEAIEAYRKALELDPKNLNLLWLHHLEKWILVQQGQAEEVRLAWEKELKDNPPNHIDWYGYAELCLFLGKEAEYRTARRVMLDRFGKSSDPFVAERTGRACLLLPASGEELHQAVALIDRSVPKSGADCVVLFGKGLAEYRQGRLNSAISVLEGEASRVLGPTPHLVLAMAQHATGQKEKARKTLAAAILTYNWGEPWAFFHYDWISHVLRREAETLIIPNLEALLQGTQQPQDNDERLCLLGICQFQSRHRALARLYADAFAAEPKLADDLRAGTRHNAASAAALAASGQGKDAANLEENEYARLRGQSLAWLRADLAAWVALLKKEPDARVAVRDQMQNWRDDKAFAGVRGAAALAKLPEGERQEWHKLWQEVAKLAKRPAK